jgi:hypothetical protein
VIRRLGVLTLVLLCAVTQAQVIQLSTSKFGSHFGYLRHLMTAPSADAAFGDSVAALWELEKQFPDQITLRSGKVHDAKDVGKPRIQELYWRSIDVLAYSSTDLSMLRTLPTRIDRPIGRHLPIKQAVQAVEKAIKLSEKAWERSWEARRLELKSQQQVWQNIYGGRADRDLRDIAARLGFSKTPTKVEIVMLPYMGGKEGMTIQTMDGWKVIIGSNAHQSSAFAEVVLHETAHVMDLLSGENSFIGHLRKTLTDARRSEQEIEQIPHLIIFLAGATQIQSREPQHRPVGAQTGAFDRLPAKFFEAARAGFEKLPDQAAATAAILSKL